MGHRVYVLKPIFPRDSDIAAVGNEVNGFGDAKFYSKDRREHINDHRKYDIPSMATVKLSAKSSKLPV
jgi:hypothetical protein